MLKHKKQKTDNECQNQATNLPSANGGAIKTESNKTPQTPVKKRQSSKSPATIIATSTVASPILVSRKLRTINLSRLYILSTIFS